MPNETDALLLPSTAEGDEYGLEWEEEEHEPEEDPSQHEEATSVYARMKQAVESSSDMTQSAREALSVEYHHVQAALVDHLQEANDEGIRDFVLTMGLTKNLSLLPSKPEVVQAAEEMEDAVVSLRRRMSVSLPAVSESEQPSSPEKKEASGPVPLSAYLTLASAVTALSSIGPFLAKQQGVDATMKIVWRFQGTAVLLAPLALHSVLADTGWPRLTYAQWGTFVTAAASYAVLCVAFAMSINYTTVANATILTNSQSILLVAAKCFVGQNVLFLEVFGVAVAFLGGVLCARESAGDEGAPAQGWLSVWGDCLGLISSVGGIGYIVLGKSLRSHMPVLFFMVLNMTTASFLILFYMWITGIEFSWGRNVNHGVFGWMNLQGDRLPLELATVFVVRGMRLIVVVACLLFEV